MLKYNDGKYDIEKFSSYRVISTSTVRRNSRIYKICIDPMGLFVRYQKEEDDRHSLEFIGHDKGYDSIMVRVCDTLMDRMVIPLSLRIIHRRCEITGKRTNVEILPTNAPNRFGCLNLIDRSY